MDLPFVNVSCVHSQVPALLAVRSIIIIIIIIIIIGRAQRRCKHATKLEQERGRRRASSLVFRVHTATCRPLAGFFSHHRPDRWPPNRRQREQRVAPRRRFGPAGLAQGLLPSPGWPAFFPAAWACIDRWHQVHTPKHMHATRSGRLNTVLIMACLCGRCACTDITSSAVRSKTKRTELVPPHAHTRTPYRRLYRPHGHRRFEQQEVEEGTGKREKSAEAREVDVWRVKSEERRVERRAQL